jgi:5-methylcytosine-specific restriction endonuclease McrA
MRSDFENLEHVLQVFTSTGNRSERQSFAAFSEADQARLVSGYAKSVNLARASRERLEAELSLLLTLKLLWSLIPERLFRGLDPDFEALARASLSPYAKGESPPASVVAGLSRIFRRLRNSQVHGRRNLSGLDTSRPLHRDLLASQSGACAVCLFVFPSVMTEYPEEPDQENYKERYVPVVGEVCLPSYYRRPVLDHIVPYYLGGDGPENWQILCASCNAGKGEALSWLLRSGWLPAKRPSELSSLTASLRYSALVSCKAEFRERGPVPGKTLRLFRNDPEKLALLDNLTVALC